MHAAKYWAKHDVTLSLPDYRHPVTWSVWRGSDISEAHAADLARAAGERTARERRAGGEPQWYDYIHAAKPEPMLEDFHEPDAEPNPDSPAATRTAAITLSRYGCQVLNTRDLAFIDIDDAHHQSPGLLARLFSRTKNTPEDAVLTRLHHLITQVPHAGARVYRTAAGFRVLLLSPSLDPTSSDAETFMRELHADPLYVQLCRTQRCYRARLTPKPWRLPCGAPPAPIRYDTFGRADPLFDEWQAEYTEQSEAHAVCDLIAETGATLDQCRPGVRHLVDVHDAQTRVGTGLPLA